MAFFLYDDENVSRKRSAKFNLTTEKHNVDETLEVNDMFIGRAESNPLSRVKLMDVI